MTRQKNTRAALYLRVSTKNGQTTDNQHRALRKVAKHRGWEIVEVYQDEGYLRIKGGMLNHFSRYGWSR